MSKVKSFFYGMAFGGLVSGAFTLLTTPKTGKNLRDDIQLGNQKFRNTAKHLKTEGIALKEQVQEVGKESSELLKDFTSDVKTAVTEWKADTDIHQKNIKTELKNIEDTIQELETYLKK